MLPQVFGPTSPLPILKPLSLAHSCKVTWWRCYFCASAQAQIKGEWGLLAVLWVKPCETCRRKLYASRSQNFEKFIRFGLMMSILGSLGYLTRFSSLAHTAPLTNWSLFMRHDFPWRWGLWRFKTNAELPGIINQVYHHVINQASCGSQIWFLQ